MTAENSINQSAKETVLLCSERGWRLNLKLQSGDGIKGCFITAVDENEKAIVVERPGERHIKPRIVFMHEILSAEAIWKKD